MRLAVAEIEFRKDRVGSFKRDQSYPEAASGESGYGPSIDAGAVGFVVELLGAGELAVCAVEIRFSFVVGSPVELQPREQAKGEGSSHPPKHSLICCYYRTTDVFMLFHRPS